MPRICVCLCNESQVQERSEKHDFSSQTLETTEMPVNIRMDKYILVYWHNGIQYSNEDKQELHENIEITL